MYILLNLTPHRGSIIIYSMEDKKYYGTQEQLIRVKIIILIKFLIKILFLLSVDPNESLIATGQLDRGKSLYQPHKETKD